MRERDWIEMLRERAAGPGDPDEVVQRWYRDVWLRGYRVGFVCGAVMAAGLLLIVRGLA